MGEIATDEERQESEQSRKVERHGEGRRTGY